MKIKTVWTSKMLFTAAVDDLFVAMDAKAPIGEGTAVTPKQMLVAAICGCTGMDVVALLKKYQQPLTSFVIEAEASVTNDGHPIVFKEVQIIFKLEGDLVKEKVLEAVTLSQTKYCSVSAMLSKSFPINYSVQLNSITIGAGSAHFEKGDL